MNLGRPTERTDPVTVAKWKGCGFLRTTAELAAMPGHPAVKVGARHERAFASWLSEEFDLAGFDNPQALARQILLLLDGAFSASPVHRDASWFEEAGQAARAPVDSHRRKPMDHPDQG